MKPRRRRCLPWAPARIGSAIITGVLLAGLLLSGSPASAAPATVKVFEGTARERPEPTAPVLKTFPEDTDLSVSEEATDGWRRVRLPDGGVGYMREEELELEERAAAARPTALPRPRSLAPSRPAILYIKDLSHLAEVVRRDQEVHQMAEALNSRRTAAIGVTVGGLLLGAMLIVGAEKFFTHQTCSIFTSGGPNGPVMSSICTDQSNQGLFFAGLGTGVVGVVAGGVLWPKRNDLLDVINKWNDRHEDNPITFDQGVSTHRD